MAALEERNARISEGLAAAQRGQQDLEDAQAKVSDSLNDAKQQAQEIINQAQKRANEIVDEAKDAARDEADKIKVAATADIDQQVNSAREAAAQGSFRRLRWQAQRRSSSVKSMPRRMLRCSTNWLRADLGP